jgi:hypothetical protein
VACPGAHSLEGLWISALELSIGIFDPHVFFEQATEFERAKASVGRVSAPTHSPKSAPLSDSMLSPQFAGCTAFGLIAGVFVEGI